MEIEFIKKDREYSLYELLKLIEGLKQNCKLIAKDQSQPVEMRIVANQIVDYGDNIMGAMFYLRPTELKQWCSRLQTYAEQLVAMIQNNP